MTELDYWRAEHDTSSSYEEIPTETPCDAVDIDGQHHCPFVGQTSESELCRVMCGLGVDE